MSQKNRLNLDFKLIGRKERLQYANNYLRSIPFTPTSDEIETISNYILWGVDEKGLNGRQEGLELETRYKTWDSVARVESLDALIESPGFSETSLRGPLNPPIKVSRQVFSRGETRKKASTGLLENFEGLWREIDEIEFMLSVYEIKVGKKVEVREALQRRIQANHREDALRAKGENLSAYNYLKLKHQLVELRKEQYVLKDSFAPTLMARNTFVKQEVFQDTFFGEDVEILPFGLKKKGKVFWSQDFSDPGQYSEEDLREVSGLLWREPLQTKFWFDFGDEEHLYALFGMLEEIEDFKARSSMNEGLEEFLDTLRFYWELADLDEVQEFIVEKKILKWTNQQIAEEIFLKFGKKYQSNYISTLYCKKGLAKIAAAAKNHRKVLENVFFPENFKQCKDCKRFYLLDGDNFVKRHRSNDGFSPRCKKCEKVKRDRSKE